MKANNKALRNDDDAQVGIGTMIVFIATILVAAVAAGVLINVSGGLQSKAVATGTDATENVASNLLISSAYGFVDGASINSTTLYLQLGAGSEAIDLSDVVIQYSDGATLVTVKGNATEVSGNLNDVLEAGEYWKLSFDQDGGENFNDNGLGWVEGTSVEVRLIPTTGNPAQVAFTTPDAYGGNTYVQLF